LLESLSKLDVARLLKKTKRILVITRNRKSNISRRRRNIKKIEKNERMRKL